MNREQIDHEAARMRTCNAGRVQGRKRVVMPQLGPIMCAVYRRKHIGDSVYETLSCGHVFSHSAVVHSNASIGQPRNTDGSINYHFLDGGRWWDSPACHMGSHCARGINFHDFGKVPRGRHALNKKAPLESTQGMLEESE